MFEAGPGGEVVRRHLLHAVGGGEGCSLARPWPSRPKRLLLLLLLQNRRNLVLAVPLSKPWQRKGEVDWVAVVMSERSMVQSMVKYGAI